MAIDTYAFICIQVPSIKENLINWLVRQLLLRSKIWRLLYRPARSSREVLSLLKNICWHFISPIGVESRKHYIVSQGMQFIMYCCG